jgi:membrane-bound serine protease (ClpP class)
VVALVLQLNSAGSVVDDDRIVALARKIARSPVPVAIWVGPSNAQATGPAAQPVAVARPGGLAPGAKVGRAGEQVLPRDEFGVLYGESANRLRDGFVRYDDARTVGLVDAATLGDFVIDLEGVATREAAVAGETRRELVTTGRSVKLPLGKQVMHTVASASVAYLLFVIGVGLIVFELFTAGIGLAGLCGAAFLVLGCFGLAVLPARWWALGLLLASFVAFAADVQLGVPRLPTAIGGLLFAAGTLTLYDGVSLSWITMLAAFVLLGVVYLRGMPAMVRSRFSTADIGRDWLAGESGVVTTTSGDEGVVAVRSARWPARAATPSGMVVGERVTVVGADGIVLEVASAEAAASAPENASVGR